MNEPASALSLDSFRLAMRHVATGVTIVTTMLEGAPKGFTATAFSSVSLEPPTVLVCVNRQARTFSIITQAQRFCVNVLAREDAELARRFANKLERPFEGVPYHGEATGAPIFESAFAYFDCDVVEEYAAATHAIFIGRVRACGSRDGAPLGYFNAGYRDFGMTFP